MQFGDTWPDEQSLTEFAVNVTPLGVVSLENGVTVCVAPTIPDEVSATATGAGGGVTVGVIVPSDFCPKESATTYLIGVAVPVKDGKGSNVTAPDVGLKV